ncbi:diguanylate cyclase [Pseudoduganella sp. FT93W]|uniref:Diguanylate cyclase n=1 Tax=Duganella fentianensis TaxID=2692177 RepID=A0A845HX91_9BURK|nr:sensor domain-containing diguanylate cyclase [Duganella fentianensis]MYN45613.1 diguanylate cyclase [Duganella fentianensis]
MKANSISPSVLLEVIRVQTEIARLGLDLGGVMQLVCQYASSLCHGDGAVVELAEGDEMVYRATAGIAEGQLGLRLQRSGSLSGLCVTENRILQCDDSETDPRVDRPACRKVGFRSMLVVPLHYDHDIVGVLKVIAVRTHAFSPEIAQILGLLSELIGAAIFNAAKYESSDLYVRATHDDLTGLANRSLFYDRLRQQLAVARRAHSQLAIISIDMDGLKTINDSRGHRAGDAAIRQVAQRIGKVLREGDLAARLGGDEFAVLLPSVRDRASMDDKCARLRLAISAPFLYEGRELPLAASIGYAICPEQGYDLDELMDQADQAMYRAKQQRHAAVEK